MRPIAIFLRALTLSLILSSSVAAAEFVLTSWGDWKGDELFAKVKSDYVAMDLMDLSLSKTMTYDKGHGLVLYRKELKEDKTVFVPAVKVSVPASIIKPLVMLYMVEGSVRYRVLEMSPEKYPGSSIRFVNLSPRNLVVTFGEKNYGLKPASEVLVKPQIREKKAVQITASIITGESKLQKMYSSMILNRPKKRMVMFFHPTGPNELHCRSLVDFVRD
ncbi:hypothetical protein [Oceaniferula spumae]